MVGDEDFGNYVTDADGNPIEVRAVGGFTLTGEAFWAAMEATGSGWIRPVVGEHMDTGLNDD